MYMFCLLFQRTSVVSQLASKSRDELEALVVKLLKDLKQQTKKVAGVHCSPVS